MIERVLQGNATWQLNFHDLTDHRIAQITRYGIVYAIYSEGPYEGRVTLEEVQENAFWAGVVLKTRSGSAGPYITGKSLSFLLGTANETGATSGPIIGSDMFTLTGVVSADADIDMVLGSKTSAVVSPETAIENIFTAAELPTDFPLRLGTQDWEPGSTLLTEIPNWYTLMQGLNAVTGIASPSGGWYVKPNGEVIVGTGNRIFKTPPHAEIVSAEPEVHSSVWDTPYQAEILNVTVDATRTIGRALIVGDGVTSGVEITDDAWALGGINSSAARLRAATIETGGSLSAEDAMLLSKRIVQSRAREEVLVEMQFPARSKIATVIQPGDVVGIVETKANWPTQPNPEAWVAFLAGYAINPYPAIITSMSIPFTRGMGVYYSYPDSDSVIDLTNFVQWEHGSKINMIAGDAVSTLYETLLNTSSFTEIPTAIPVGADWEWR